MMRPHFYLSMTHPKAPAIIQAWPGQPFTHLLITPLFASPRLLAMARTLKEQGATIMFDSGGYQVQTGRITYADLVNRLGQCYRSNNWADWYVLPDCVPTSSDSEKVVECKIQETIRCARQFLEAMPNEIHCRAIGVIHGRTLSQIWECIEAYAGLGITYFGFGAFGTSGPNGSINVVSNRCLWILKKLHLPRLHIFGVGGPSSLTRLWRNGIAMTSFDSAGWWKAGAYGNIFLPGRPQIHVTSLPLHPGVSIIAAEKQLSGHHCPFCEDIPALWHSRLNRIMHNLAVMREMTEIQVPQPVQLPLL